MMKGHVFALTASPTLDLSGIVNQIIPSEKNYVYDQIKSPGGNGINAARILTRLRIPTLATGFLGGSVGEEIKFLLDKEGVKNRFIPIKEHSRICVTVSNRSDHQQTRLTFPGPHISPNEKRALFSLVANDKKIKILVMGGSLPSGFEVQDAKKILKIMRQKNIPCIVDCPGMILRDLINERPTLIKPNLMEFQEATRSSGFTIQAVRQAAQKILEKVPYVCVSSVEDGALLITRDKSYFGKIPKIKIRSTVGAGDSMVGAMTAQLFQKNASAQDILRWGLAAAAATLSNPGTAFGTASEIQMLYKKTKVETILHPPYFNNMIYS
jgi:1-phosphofructokinase family hexose kinase